MDILIIIFNNTCIFKLPKTLCQYRVIIPYYPTFVVVYARDHVCYWVRPIEAKTHSRDIMKWDTKALRAVLTSGPVIDIPAPDLSVISAQQSTGEGGEMEWEGVGRTKESGEKLSWQFSAPACFSNVFMSQTDLFDHILSHLAGFQRL